MHLKQVLVPSDDTALNWTITPLHHYEEGWNSERPFCPGRPLCRQPSDGISFGAFVTVKEDFLLLSHDLTLKIIEKNKTKAMIKKKKKQKTAQRVVYVYHLYGWDRFYCLWNYYKTSVKHVKC